MGDPSESDEAGQSNRPGKTRTWWHPLLVRLLDRALSGAYDVRDEVLVGKMPLRLDILLIHRESGQLSESGRRDAAALLPLLNRFTLVEFKGPTDGMEPGDLGQLIGCAYLWHSQQVERIEPREISLIVLAPTVNEALRDELLLLGGSATEREPGILQASGLPMTTWLVDTDVMAKRGQPILSVVSRVFLRHRQRIIQQLMRSGHGVLLGYMLQQVQQFLSLGEAFAMQHTGSEYMTEVEDELLTSVLESIPPERRLQGLSPERRLQGLSPQEFQELLRALPLQELLRGLAPEERLQGLAPEERLRGLAPEERLRGLSVEELIEGLSEEQLRELRERKQNR
jgi:hypothetical protein